MSFSIAGSPSRFAPPLRLALASICGCIIGAGNACNVYTPDMLVSGAGGIPAIGGHPSTGGVATGGLGFGGVTIAGAGGTLPSATGGAASGGEPPAVGGFEAAGGAVATGGTTSITAGGGSGQASTATGGLSSGGTSVVPTGGSGLGGATPATGGTSTTAAGGSAGTVGSGGHVGSGGLGTGGTTSIPCDANIVDDMRDATPAILVCDGRSGTWFSFGSDPSLFPTPAPKGSFIKTAATASDQSAIGAAFKAELSGSTADTNSCGMGFTLKATSAGTKLPYSLAGKKLSFKYRTTGIVNGNLVLAIPIMATVPVAENGSCTSNCYNHYFVQLDSTNGQWSATKEIPIVTGDGKTGFMQAQWSGNAGLVTWDPTQALVVQFAVSGLSAPYTVEVGPIKLLSQ